MSTLIRPWTVSLNNVPGQATALAQGQNVLFALKTHFLAGGYTMIGSSDSVTAGIDGVDRILTAANLIWAAAGVAHSWFIVGSPPGALPASKRIFKLFGCSSGAASPHRFNCVEVSNAGFTGGSITADPTRLTAGTDFNPTTGGTFKEFLRAGGVNSKYHMLRNTSGDVLFLTSADGGGIVQGIFGACFTANFRPGNVYPVFSFASYADTGHGAFAIANLIDSTQVMMWHPTTGAILAGTYGAAIPCYGNGGAAVLSSFAAAGSFTDASYPAVPSLIASASPIEIYGTLVDIAMAPSGAAPQGREEPASGTTTTMIVGDTWQPNGGVALSL